MHPGHASAVISFPRNDRHVSGVADEIGERFLFLDNNNEPSLELLRFRETLTTTPGFEVTLRRRIERLRHFGHPAFVTTPSAEYFGQERSLALLSSYTAGRRLSELLPHAQDPALAAALVHHLAPALHALREYDDDVGHGALTASRVVIRRDAPLIVEHVLGPALERLHLSPAGMRLDLGIPVPASPHVAGVIDCYQLAVIALSMLAGRRLRPQEYSNLQSVLDDVFPAPDVEAAEPIVGLRMWIERALQLVGRGFTSSKDAIEALGDVSVAVNNPAALWSDLLERGADKAGQSPEVTEPSLETSLPIHLFETQAPPQEPDSPEHPTITATVPEESVPGPIVARQSSFFSRPRDFRRWALIAVSLFAIAEAAIITVLLTRPKNAPPPASVAEIALLSTDPGLPVMVDGRAAGVTPLQLTIRPDTRSISLSNPQPASPRQESIVGSTGQENTRLANGNGLLGSDPRARSVAPVAAPPPRTGVIRVSSPIALELFDGDTRLGSSASGTVTASAGRRQIDFVNTTLGFRSRQTIDVKAGQTVSATVSPPNGRLNINAVPWAEVLVDGKSVGETPIGNLSVSLGDHEILFRHPQLGEVRRTAVVRADGPTRVSANLER